MRETILHKVLDPIWGTWVIEFKTRGQLGYFIMRETILHKVLDPIWGTWVIEFNKR